MFSDKGRSDPCMKGTLLYSYAQKPVPYALASVQLTHRPKSPFIRKPASRGALHTHPFLARIMRYNLVGGGD